MARTKKQQMEFGTGEYRSALAPMNDAARRIVAAAEAVSKASDPKSARVAFRELYEARNDLSTAVDEISVVASDAALKAEMEEAIKKHLELQQQA